MEPKGGGRERLSHFRSICSQGKPSCSRICKVLGMNKVGEGCLQALRPCAHPKVIVMAERIHVEGRE